MRRLVVVAALATAGCGGGGSEADPLAGWRSATDATCREAQARIAERGRPARVSELEPSVTAALADVRIAIEEIAARPLPDGSEARVRPFVDALEALEPRLGRVFDARDFRGPSWTATEIDRIHEPLSKLSEHARRAGLRDCAPDDFSADVIETMQTPRFLEGLARAKRRFAAAVEHVRDPVGSRERRFWYWSGVVDDFEAAYHPLDELYPPQDASKHLTKAMDIIRAATDLADGIAGAAMRGEPLSPVRIQAAFRTHQVRLAATLERAAAAAPAG